jgi:hypothetical protein
MTKALTGLGGLALLTVLYLPAGASASAGSVVAKDTTCAVLDAEGRVAFGQNSMVLSTPSGHSIVKCSVTGVNNSTGRAVRHDYESTGMTCMTAAGATTDWHETISASGNATLTCRMK